jgi:hypothetical protein
MKSYNESWFSFLFVPIFCAMAAGDFAQATQITASERAVLIQGSETGDRFSRPVLCVHLNPFFIGIEFVSLAFLNNSGNHSHF